MLTRAAAVLFVVAALSVSCGSNQGPKDSPAPTSSTPLTPSPTTPAPTTTAPTTTPTKTPTKPVLPKCTKVWVPGNRLPARYAGCTDGGKTVPAHSRTCVVGHDLVVYRNSFYAMTTGKIFQASDLPNDHGYQLIVDLCKHGAPTGQ